MTVRHRVSMTAVGLLFAAAMFEVTPGAQREKTRSLPNADSSNFMPFDQITKANVNQLEVAWSYPYGATTFSPVVVDGVLYGLGRNASAATVGILGLLGPEGLSDAARGDPVPGVQARGDSAQARYL